jgi:hypothetical protein
MPRHRGPKAALILALAATAALAPATTLADDMAAQLCPILDAVAGSTAGYLPEAVQAQLVMQVAGAYDYDPAALDAVLEGADAATSAACPEARTAILTGTAKPSLADAMR